MQPVLPGLLKVFPACAGVIRVGITIVLAVERFPRMRGGDPNQCDKQGLCLKFSPHARG